ncbi:helix-turn-helix transcriptional regulator [Symbiopectobacterium sp. Eva_TO]
MEIERNKSECPIPVWRRITASPPCLLSYLTLKTYLKILKHGDDSVAHKYVYPTDEERRKLLNSVNEPYERFIREDERHKLTAIGKISAWKWEQEGRFPKRIKLGATSNAWRLSEVLHWMQDPPVRDLSKNKQSSTN